MAHFKYIHRLIRDFAYLSKLGLFFRAELKEAATACFRGIPSSTSLLILWLIVSFERPFRRGILKL